MGAHSLAHLSDGDLERALSSVVARERSSTVEVVAHVAEFEARRLHVPAGFPSMFAYCVKELHFSEQGALKRIRAARAAREYPAILEALAAGRLHLTAVVLLKPHLNRDNVEELIQAATHKTQTEVELLIAERFPRSDLPTRLDAVTAPQAQATSADQLSARTVAHAVTSCDSVPTTTLSRQPVSEGQAQGVATSVELSARTVATGFPKLKPLAPERFALQVTIGKGTHDKLRHAQELLSHQIPSGDLAQVLDRALDALISKLEKRKFAATESPRASTHRVTSSKRHIPAHVKRAVRDRDQGQCTFVGDTGHRCESRKFLEFDHVDPVARGGQASVDSIRLRCRAHNQLEAERAFGDGFMHQRRGAALRT